jgi:adenylate cyclase
MRLFAEVHRRGILKVATGYLIVSWLVLEVGHTLFNVFELPHAALQLIFVLLTLGFPIALLGAWQGWFGTSLQRDSHAAAGVGHAHAGVSHHEGPWLAAVFGAVALFTVAVAIGVRLFGMGHSGSHSEHDSAATASDGAAQAPAVLALTDKSIAVLPFADLTEKHDQAYFADGLAQELVDVLGKIPDLRVIGHASSFQFKGKTEDLTRVGSELGAAHLVEGSVRRSGDRIRVAAQLVRASDGAHEWSGTYDRSVDDLLQVQTEIAMSLGRALELSVSDLQEPRIANRVSAEVYDLYLRGLHANDRTSDEGFAEASNYLQRAIELDPHFVRAHEQLANTHLLQAVFGAVPADVGFGRVRDDAVRLLKLDPSSGWGQTLLCRYNTEYSWDWSEAERECAAALARAPRFWLALYATADLALIRGEYGKSERLFKEIFPTDPLNADTYMELGLTLRAVGRFADAETAFRRGLAITPTYITGHFELGSILLAEGRIEDAQHAFGLEAPEYGQQAGLAMAYHASGRNADAAAALENFIQDHGKEQPMLVADAYSYLGDADHAFDWLERAYRQKDPLMPYVKSDSRVHGLVHDARYKAFLKKLNLPE